MYSASVHFLYLAHFISECKMFQTKVVEEFETHFIFSTFFFRNRAVCEIMWKNDVERGRPHMTIWRMRIAWWIPKAINKYTGCVLLITFPLQQWLHERSSMLCYTHIACFNFSSAL